MKQITKTQKELLDVLSKSLFDRKNENVEINIDILKEAKHQAVLSLMNVDVIEFPQVYNLQAKILFNNMRIEYEHVDAHRLMLENKVPYVVLKGVASAIYYPEPSLRTMGDVDLLVLESDLEKVDKILRANGFCQEDFDAHHHHIVYQRHRNGLRSVWEVHWKSPGIPNGESGIKIQKYLSNIIDCARIHKIPSGEYQIPMAFHHGLVMLLHIAGHLINTGIGLRHLCDWAVFVATFSDDEFCAMFEEKLKAVGLWRFAQLLTQLSIKYLGCPKKDWCGNGDEEYLNKMMQDIMDGGNFGEKDKNRINQAKLMTNTGKGVDDTSILKQFFLTMNDKAKRGMPIVAKVPVLLPIGWAYVGFRHLLRMIQGRRPSIDVGDMISGATKRKEIYREFRLFEEEK